GVQVSGLGWLMGLSKATQQSSRVYRYLGKPQPVDNLTISRWAIGIPPRRMRTPRAPSRWLTLARMNRRRSASVPAEMFLSSKFQNLGRNRRCEQYPLVR